MVMTREDVTSRQSEWPRLETAQRNIQQFVMHREFKRVMQHENAASALRLAMLVSLSESNLVEEGTTIDNADHPEESCMQREFSGRIVSSVAQYREDESWTRPSEAARPRVEGTGRREAPHCHDVPEGGPNSRNVADRRGGHARGAKVSERAAERAAELEDKEQAELRRKRLELEENLRRKRVHERDAAAKLVDSSSSSKSRDSTLDSLRTGSPTLRPKEAHAVAVDTELFDAETSFEERREADADEDWQYIRGRGAKEPRKPARSPKKIRRLRPLAWPKGRTRLSSATVKSYDT